MTKDQFVIMILSGVFAALSLRTVGAEMLIDTTPTWTGTGVGPFGDGPNNTATMGQVITVPTNGDSVLRSFTFYMNQPTSIVFRGEVYAWSGGIGGHAIGDGLFESPPMTTSSYVPQVDEPITFETAGIALAPGQQYVLFASTSKDETGSAAGTWGLVGPDPYLGGGVVALYNGSDVSQWTNPLHSWEAFWPADLVFKADFVPEPVELALVVVGLLPVFGRRRHV